MIKRHKLLAGLMKRLDELLEESGVIFQEEYPWLFNDSLKPEIVTILRRHQNDMEIDKTRQAIAFEIFLEEKKRTPTVQAKLLLDN